MLGAGGQLLLFHAVRIGPPYLIFPIISLSPALTIALSFAMLKERTGLLGVLGIALALLALPLFDYRAEGKPPATGCGSCSRCWCWRRGACRRTSSSWRTPRMDAASIFFYMMLSGLLLVPVALAMTDFSQPINYGLDGPGLAAAIQMLNSIGALTLVFAFRYGKAIIVSPLVNAGAPLLTAILSHDPARRDARAVEAGGHRARAAGRAAARAAARATSRRRRRGCARGE